MSKRLSLAKRFLKWRVGDARFEEYRAESKRWKTNCPKCNQPHTYWAIGGAVRKGSIFGGPLTIEQGALYRCPKCRKWSLMTFARF